MPVATPGGSLRNLSGVLAAAATAQTISAENRSRQYLFIQNLAAADDLWVNFGIPAVASQPSIKIPAGAALEFAAGSTGVVPTALVSVIGATINNPYTAKEG